MTQSSAFIIIAGMIAACIGASITSYIITCRSLEHSAKISLSAIRDTQKELIEKYFASTAQQVQALAVDPTIISAMKEFKAAFISLAKSTKTMNLDIQRASLYLYYYDDFIHKLNLRLTEAKKVSDFFPVFPIGILLQAIYIADNPNPINKKENLINASEAKEYNLVHQKYHALFNEMKNRLNYYDMFLIDSTDGNIYYTVEKEIDFANNLLKTKLHESNLSYLVTKASKSTSPELVDFKPYDPSFAAPAAFIGASIVDGGKKLGIFAIQISINQLNAILTNNEKWQSIGLGKTGETYLVGRDTTMRSVSRRFAENKYSFLENAHKTAGNQLIISNMREFGTTMLLQEVDTPSVHAALNGDTGIIKSLNYEGEQVLSAYAPITIKDLHWAILAEQSIHEICTPAQRQALIIFGGLLFSLLSLLAFYVYKKKQL